MFWMNTNVFSIITDRTDQSAIVFQDNLNNEQMSSYPIATKNARSPPTFNVSSFSEGC